MRRRRHLKQAASRFLRQSLVNHLSREQPCLQMIDRTFPSCPSSRVGQAQSVLLDYFIQNKIQISLRAACLIPFVADQEQISVGIRAAARRCSREARTYGTHQTRSDAPGNSVERHRTDVEYGQLRCRDTPSEAWW